MKLETREKQLDGLAQKAATKTGTAALKAFQTAVEDILGEPLRESGWPTTASTLHHALNALSDACRAAGRFDALARLGPGLLRAIAKYPTNMGLPCGLEPVNQFGADGLASLTDCLAVSLSKVSRPELEQLQAGNPRNLPAFAVASDALRMLLAYAPDSKWPAGISWSDEQLWVLFRLVSEWGDSEQRQLRTDSAADLLLPVLEAVPETSRGDGYARLLGLFSRLFPKRVKKPPGLAAFPKRFPDDIEEALALVASWNLKADEVERGKPARPKAIESLAAKFKAQLPRDLVTLLQTHESLSDGHFGPPSRMRELLRDLKDEVREHLEEEPIQYGTRGYYDVTLFLDGAIPLGTDDNGDMMLLATLALGSTGHLPVIRFHHDQARACSVEADSLAEYVCLRLGAAFARREGLQNEHSRRAFRKRRLLKPARPSRA